MSSLGKIGLVLAVLIASGAAWFYSKWDHASLRYRLTYEVAIDGEIRTGSGVIEVRREDTTALPLPNTGYGYSVRGEAPVVDLGGGRYIFSLLTDSGAGRTDAAYLPYVVFADRITGARTPVDATRHLMASKPRAVLTSKQIPLLVTFGDIADPKSVRRVDPDNLAASFGPGVSLKTITLEITDEKVTEGRVEKVLGWLESIKGRLKPTNKKYADELTVEETLYSTNFKKG